jgi:hypothetical protein
MEGSPNDPRLFKFSSTQGFVGMVIPKQLRDRFGLNRWLAILTALSLGIGQQASPSLAGEDHKSLGPALQETTKEQLALIQHLNAIGAVFYGSWDCPHCLFQKDLFSQEASDRLNYVECGKPKQLPNQAAECKEVAIRAYPTWILKNGERRIGVQSIEELIIWTKMPTSP